MFKLLLAAIVMLALSFTSPSWFNFEDKSEDLTDQPEVDIPEEQPDNTQPKPSSYSAILNWIAPSIRENGEFMTPNEIGGYEITYWKDTRYSTPRKEKILVKNAYTTEYEIKNLSTGTYHFTIAAYDNLGVFSAPTNEVQKSFN